jgi:hypothetical protein
MCETPEPNVIEKLRERLQQGELTDVSITYRVAGGMPADNRIEEELHISRDSIATARMARGMSPPVVATEAVDPAEVVTVLRQIEQDIGTLIPRAEARFMPDSTVGSITIGIGEEQETYFFLVDEEAERDRDLPGIPEVASAENTLAQMLHRLIDTRGD